MTCELSLQTTGKESSLVQMVNNSLSILLHIIISCFQIFIVLSYTFFVLNQPFITFLSALFQCGLHTGEKFVVCRVPVIIMVKRAAFPSYGHLEFFIFLTRLAG